MVDGLTVPLVAGISLVLVTSLKTDDCFLEDTESQMCWNEGWLVAGCIVLAMSIA